MIDFNAFVEWAVGKFGEDAVLIKGKEVLINSIFTDDSKHHLSCNPSGGRKRVKDGCYRCLKTEKKGTLIGLVMLVENCDYRDAKRILGGEISIHILEEQLEEFFREKQEKEEIKNKPKIQIPGKLISDLPVNSNTRIAAESYLKKRKLPINGLYVGESGKYINRIIIPYYNPDNELVYYNGRNMGSWGVKYRNPDKELGLSKTDVVYTPQWPTKGEKVYLTEGEFDSLTLYICGFNAMACGGKTLFEKQLEILRSYKVCLALDNDSSGFNAFFEMAKTLLKNNIEVSYVFPPKGIKDWNEMLVALKKEIVFAWVKSKEEIYDEWTEFNLKV